MNQFQTIRNLDIDGKRLLIRVDFNVPLGDGQVASDRRIRAALPTIRYALRHNARLVLMTHLGRPGGKPDVSLSLRPVARRLEELLDGISVELVQDGSTKPHEYQFSDAIVLLENLRFHPGEKNADEGFAKQLAAWGDIYVNDAFATCHRKHASMYGVPQQFPEGKRAIGLLVQSELQAIDEFLDSPESPFVVVLGGAKVADKIGIVDRLLQRVDQILIGGAMAYTFLKADSRHVGASIVEERHAGFAKRLVTLADDRMHLPKDHVIAEKPDATAQIERADGGIPEGWYGMDIGPKTINEFCSVIEGASTVIWNGPMGKFEDEPFRHGTEAIVHAIANTKARTLVGGGESGQAVEQFGVADRIDYVSTGGGAFLTYLKDRELPALEVIDEVHAEAEKA